MGQSLGARRQEGRREEEEEEEEEETGNPGKLGTRTRGNATISLATRNGLIRCRPKTPPKLPQEETCPDDVRRGTRTNAKKIK